MQKVQIESFNARLEKGKAIPDKDVCMVNRINEATAIINTKGEYAHYMTPDNYYSTHIIKKDDQTNNITHRTYTCDCKKTGRYKYGEGVLCSGNTNTNTVCYHILRTILEIHKGQKLVLSDNKLALKKFVLTLDKKPEYIKIVNKQNNNKFFWGLVLTNN